MPYFREFVDVRNLTSARRRKPLGKVAKRGTIVNKTFTEPSVERIAERLKRNVTLAEIRAVAQRTKEVILDIPVCALDAAFLIPLCSATIRIAGDDN